jgi:flagellar biosynthesis chaperone FliJ
VVLKSLSHAEKDALILSLQAFVAELQATIAEQQKTIEELRASVTQLETRLAANSTNSNRPAVVRWFEEGSA